MRSVFAQQCLSIPIMNRVVNILQTRSRAVLILDMILQATALDDIGGNV